MNQPTNFDQSGPWSASAGAGPPKLSFRQILAVLFFQPQLLLLLSRDKWTRAFRILAICAFVTGAVMGAVQLPGMMERAGDWGQWLEREVGSVRLAEGTLSWERPDSVPYTTRHGSWRVDFRAAGSSFPREKRRLSASRGVWVSPDEVVIWHRMPGADGVNTTSLLADNRILSIFKVDELWPDGLRIEGREFPGQVRSLVMWAMPLFVVTQGVGVFLQVVFYAFIFAVIPYLLKSPLAAAGFGGVFTFYLYASIPPLIVAAVYDSLGLPYAGFQMFFVGVFIVYLFLAIWRISRAMQAD